MNKKVGNLISGGMCILLVITNILTYAVSKDVIYLFILVCAGYFAAFAVINGSGSELLIDKKYRGTEAARAWQKGSVLPNIACSIGILAAIGLLRYDGFPGKQFWICFLLWLIVMGGFVFWSSRNDSKFYKTMDKEDRPWLMR